ERKGVCHDKPVACPLFNTSFFLGANYFKRTKKTAAQISLLFQFSKRLIVSQDLSKFVLVVPQILLFLQV
ncbi:hypothetical protein ARL57_14545, partial [Listeria monocytogenes]|nr:hypothetical protein [Listeria monocytogenes]